MLPGRSRIISNRRRSACPPRLHSRPRSSMPCAGPAPRRSPRSSSSGDSATCSSTG
jgi:hypothetical protein